MMRVGFDPLSDQRLLQSEHEAEQITMRTNGDVPDQILEST